MNSTASPESWWIWCGWLLQDSAAHFVYGCATRCSRAPGWSQDASLQLAGSGRLEIRQRTVIDDAFRAFQDQLNADAIALEVVAGSGAPSAAIKARRVILQQGLGHSAARVTAFYFLPDVGRWITGGAEALLTLLSSLEGELNLPFKSSYASRLGNFEVFDLNAWQDGPQPFLIEAAAPPPVGAS